jgi:hypothetical protein
VVSRLVRVVLLSAALRFQILLCRCTGIMSSPDSTKHGSAVKLKLPGSGSTHTSPPAELAAVTSTEANATNAEPAASQEAQAQEAGVMSNNDHDVEDAPAQTSVSEATASISTAAAATEQTSATAATAEGSTAATADITAADAAAAHSNEVRASEIALAKQTIASQNAAVRSIVARAAADMENWRRTIGAQQEVSWIHACRMASRDCCRITHVFLQAEVYTYWESWTGHMNCVTEINNALLAYIRAAAASAAVYASSMKAGGKFHSCYITILSCFRLYAA